jgi:hypothetical protein
MTMDKYYRLWLTNNRPDLSSEDRTLTLKQKETSVHDPQPAHDTKTDRLTDRQSQCDFAIGNKCNPCRGGVEYLHRDPASRSKRRKWKSQIWDSKIWPRVLWNSDPKMNALTRTSSNYKRQTCLLVREGAPNEQTRKCHTIIMIWS